MEKLLFVHKLEFQVCGVVWVESVRALQFKPVFSGVQELCRVFLPLMLGRL